jgi:hypothetical protein
MPPLSAEAAIALTFLLSAFTMSFAGFGFALMAVPLLSLFMPVREAVALQFPYCFALFAYQAWHYRKHFCWSDVKPLAAGVLAGTLIGVLLLHRVPGDGLKKALAVLTLALVVLMNLRLPARGLTARLAQSPWWGHFCGFLSGAFFGAYTIGGPPAVLYILSVKADPQRTKSLIAAFFAPQFAALAAVYGFTGIITMEALETSLAFAPLVAAGSAAGFYAFNRASPRLYHRAIHLVLLATATALWWRA